MKLDVTAEVILSQLGYSNNEASLKQAQKAIDVTKGYEKFAKQIARKIEKEREIHPIDTTFQLVDIIAGYDARKYDKKKMEKINPSPLFF